MVQKIQKMYWTDCLLLLVFGAVSVAVLVATVSFIAPIIESKQLFILAAACAVFCGAGLLLGLIQVFVHIKKNKLAIYEEDLRNQK